MEERELRSIGRALSLLTLDEAIRSEER